MSLIFNYIGKMFVYMIPTLIIYLIIRRKSFKTVSKDSMLGEIAKCLLLLWTVGILGVTLFPDIDVHIISGTPLLDIRFPSGLSCEISIRGFENTSSSEVLFGKINLIPFFTVKEFFSADAPSHIGQSDWILMQIINLLGNVILFVPFGFIFPFINKNYRLLKTVCVFAVSISILEFLQYFTGRSCDIDDLILNLSGVILGYGICKLCYRILQKVFNLY